MNDAMHNAKRSLGDDYVPLDLSNYFWNEKNSSAQILLVFINVYQLELVAFQYYFGNSLSDQNLQK